MFDPINDLVNNLSYGISAKPGSTALSGTTAVGGTGFDCQATDGPIQGLFLLGTATGSPDSFTVTCKLQECDTSGGTYTDIATQTALVLTNTTLQGMIRAVRTKQYVRTHVTPAFTGGSSPAVPSATVVLGTKKSV